MYIKKIEINNIRAIDHFVMEFAEGEAAGWHVIIGENGSGKTTLLKAISLALIGDKRAQMLRQKWSDWMRGESKEASIELDIVGVHGENIAKNHLVLKKTFEKEPTFLGSEWMYSLSGDSPKYPNNWSAEKGDGWFSAAYGAYRRFTEGDKAWRDIFEISPKLAAHISCLEADATQSSVLEWIKLLFTKGEKGKKILEYLKKLINSEGFLPEKTKLQNIDSKGIWFRDAQKNVVEISQLSNGYASILSITLDIFFRMTVAYSEDKILEYIEKDNFVIDLPGIVLIDEIDIHLHPRWQTQIGEWFLRYFPKIQFIVTTHSPLICRACYKGTIWQFPVMGGKKNKLQGKIEGELKENLIYGNVLEAFETNAFGIKIERGEEAKRLQKIYKELKYKKRYGVSMSDEEIQELNYLTTIFHSDVADS